MNMIIFITLRWLHNLYGIFINTGYSNASLRINLSKRYEVKFVMHPVFPVGLH